MLVKYFPYLFKFNDAQPVCCSFDIALLDMERFLLINNCSASL